jgi:alkylation response protein AidB-like acyl-CoA dehydrogenase
VRDGRTPRVRRCPSISNSASSRTTSSISAASWRGTSGPARSSMTRTGHFPLENFAKLRAAGLYGIALPEALGGLGAGTLGWVAFAEELAQGDASTVLAFNMHVNATGGIAQRPAIRQELKERVAKLAAEEGRLMCTSVSEPASSSLLPVAFVPSVQARTESGGYRLYGKKLFASMFEASDYAYR